MRRKKTIGIFLLLCIAFISSFFLMGQKASALPNPRDLYLDTDYVSDLKNESAVNDFAGIYTQEQIEGFETEMQKMREEYDCNVVAFIIDNDFYDSSELSAPENVSEQFLPLDDYKSTVVLWLNVCTHNRSLYLLGYGSAEFKIQDSEADEIAHELQGYVKEQQGDGSTKINGRSAEAALGTTRQMQESVSADGGNELYVKMMEVFIRQVDSEMRQPYFFLSWWFQLAASLLVGLIIVLVLVHNTAGKMTANGRTYMNQAYSQVIGRQDIYTHTTYVRTRKSSSSGGGGGGGHSHSSGGGRF